MLKKTILILPLLLLVIVACRSDSKKEANKPHEASIMYQPSALASLMLNMLNQHQAWKIQIENDNLESALPQEFLGIHTVTPTDSNIRTEDFTLFAENYLKKVERLMSAKKNKKQVKLYNASIDACIDCHSMFCQGPIDKIKKLYIPN